MKNLKALSTFFALFLFYSSYAQDFTLDFNNSEEAEKIVRAYTSALVKGDVKTMSAQLAETAMVMNLGGTDSMTVKQHSEYFKNSTDLFKHQLINDMYLPVKVENDDVYEGEWVLSWGTNNITNKESGNSFDVPYHVVSLVANGKIQRLFYFYDMLKVLNAQGYTITPPDGN